MEHVHTALLRALAHIDIGGLVRHVPQGQEAGQEEGATACTSDQVGRIQQDCDDGSDGRTDSEAEIGGHGGSSDGLSLQDISPEELWDALVTAIEEGEAHGLRGLGSPALGLRIALDDQLAQLQGGVGGVGNVSGLPSRQPGLRYTGTPADLALREVVLLAQPHQQTSCFALVFAHETSS